MKTCPRCGNEHNKNGIYCSRSCANVRTAWNKGISCSKEVIEKIKKSQSSYWTDERRKEKSLQMKQAVLKNPESYSKKNISGRVKMYDIQCSTGITKVKGTWELKVATFLNDKGIKWTNDIEPFPYKWNDQWHLYFPDFYLIDKNIFIEVKGYKTERDKEKWAVVPNLIVIQKEDMYNLEELSFGW